jgi:stage IV sporulation protein FB
MKIQIDLRIILLAILYFIIKRLNLYFTFLVFIALHEFSHAIVGIACGFKLKEFRIMPFGLSISFYSFEHISVNKRILTYLSGPLFNFFIAIIFFSANTGARSQKILEIIYINLALAIFNLLPILPLDGGKILKEILRKKYAREIAYKKIIIIGNISFIIITILYCIVFILEKNISLFLIILYLGKLKLEEEIKMKKLIRMYDTIENSIEKNNH